jgi:predicted transcriptional regulator
MRAMQKAALTIRLDPTLKEKLKKLADQEERSMAGVAVRIIRDSLKNKTNVQN